MKRFWRFGYLPLTGPAQLHDDEHGTWRRIFEGFWFLAKRAG